jgi:polar amino acid transport system substrate-binding protein
MSQDIIAELAPGGTLRAGINLANILLVTGSTPAGEPTGVAPDMARAIAERLGVAVSYVPFASPGEVADAAGTDAWDIALIAADPQRAETIAFSAAYVEIEATYLVPAGSEIRSLADVDRPGMPKGLAATFDLFVDQKLDALAGLRPALKANAETLPGARVLDGRYTTVQQAIGTKPENTAAAAFLQAFVAEAIERHGVTGRLQVASGD